MGLSFSYPLEHQGLEASRRRRFPHHHDRSPMANPSARPGRSAPEELPKSLTDRVMARVDDARLAGGRREGAPRPKSKRRKRTPVQSSVEPSAQDLRESKSLKRVFRDLGLSYR